MKGEIAIHTSDVIGVAKVIEEVGDSIVERSHNAAVSRVITQVKTRIGREVSRVTGVQKKIINSRIRRTKRAPRNMLFIGTNAVSAIRLTARQLKSGVSYKGPQGRVKVRNGFIANGGGKGGRQIYRRVDKARLPIQAIVVDIHNSAKKAANAELKSFAPAKYQERFAHEFNQRANRSVQLLRKKR